MSTDHLGKIFSSRKMHDSFIEPRQMPLKETLKAGIADGQKHVAGRRNFGF